MNTQLILDVHRSEILESLITSPELKLFVAMPFAENTSYRSSWIFKDVICRATEMANDKIKAQNTGMRTFASPLRADKISKSATEISEDIVHAILSAHVFLADLTNGNHGALIELGMRMMAGNNKSMVLLNSGDRPHFDIFDNRYIDFTKENHLETISDALVECANVVEKERTQLTSSFKERLSAQAIYLVNAFAYTKMNLNRGNTIQTIAKNANTIVSFPGDDASRTMLLELGAQELVQHKLLRLDYTTKDNLQENDSWAYHLTELGQYLAKSIWPNTMQKLEIK